jgi:hypothetical protein
VDVCFCAFEDTVTSLFSCREWRDRAYAFVTVTEANPALALHYVGTASWKSLTPDHVLSLAARLRVAFALHTTTLMLEQQSQHLYPYMLRLFIDTHLDMLAAGPLDDAQWLLDQAHLLRVYPHALRVLCADELPDMTTTLWSTNIWYDSGKKSQRGFMHVLMHVMGKVMNQVCQGRSFDNILAAEMHAYPTLSSFIGLAIGCAILGNVRTAQRPLIGLLLRQRTATTFSPDAVREHAVDLQAWVYRYPLLSMALLRDYFLYVLECDLAFDALSATSMKWTRFKALCRQLAGDLREMLASSVLVASVQAPSSLSETVWEAMEARCAQWHEYSKAQNVKFKKGNDIDIMARKMTSIEKTLDLDLPALYAWIRADGRLEALRVYAWHSARQMRRPDFGTAVSGEPPCRVLPVGMLKTLGMNATNYDLLRQWVYDYNAYAIRDNGYCKVFKSMYANAPRDILLLKTYVRLVEFYMNDAVMCVSQEHARAQLEAVRDDLALEPWTRSPRLLGRALFCEGCQQWASAVTLASPILLGIEANGQRAVTVLPPRIASGRTGCAETALLNPLDGQLYCHRAIFDQNANAPAMQQILEEQVWQKMTPASPEETRSLNDIARPLFADFTCQRPLHSIAMVGIYRRVLHKLFGRCVYCGRLCEAHAVNMTNDGLSCGEHAEPCGQEYMEEHRIWRHLKKTRSGGSGAEEGEGGEGKVALFVANSCSAMAGVSGKPCQQRACLHFAVYDAMYAIQPMRLCKWHLHCIKALLPGHEALIYAGDQGPGTPPLPQNDVLRLLQNK